MKKKSVMAVPIGYFFAVVAVCVIGIIVGSVCDYDINAALANKTELGSFFATYGSYFSYCLYPVAGACLFVLLYGYNRIHMTNHFLTDVCFGTIITYLIYTVISTSFMRSIKEK